MKTELLYLLTFSEKRKNLLLLLKEEPKTLDEIKEILRVSSTGMLPQIRILEKRNLVCKKHNKYSLTEVGKVIAEFFQPLVNTLKVIEQYEDFWKEHDIEAIPFNLLIRINELGDYKLIKNQTNSIYDLHEEFIEHISKSKYIIGISPVFHPVYPSLFLNLAKNRTEVKLILTKEILEKVKNKYKQELQKLLNFENTKLYVSNQDIRLASSSTDRFFSMSLFFKNGDYDPIRNIISTDISAIKWGEELFDFYLKKSKELKNVYF